MSQNERKIINKLCKAYLKTMKLAVRNAEETLKALKGIKDATKR